MTSGAGMGPCSPQAPGARQASRTPARPRSNVLDPASRRPEGTGRPSSPAAGTSPVPYSRDMPATKQPTAQDAATARRILLDGMARDTGVFELAGELAPLHPRHNTFPGEVLLQVAADACRPARCARNWLSAPDR